MATSDLCNVYCDRCCMLNVITVVCAAIATGNQYVTVCVVATCLTVLVSQVLLFQ